MTDTRVALAPDRLPWLQDVPDKRHATSARQIWALGAAVVLLVAGASYWLGVQRGAIEQEPAGNGPIQRTVTTPLPQPQIMPPTGEVPIAPAPQVEPSPVPEIRSPPPPAVRTTPQRPSVATKSEPASDEAAVAETGEKAEAADESKSSPETPVTAATKTESSPPLASAKSLKLWPSRVTDGAHGRLVQIGAFGSVHQAKVGWQRMARAYPGVKRLPAVVRPARNSKGKLFYRFQIGTTSQAHSEVLCQRMQKIDFSCAVVGLPWKEKVER